MFGISLARISLLTGTSLGGGVGVSPTLDLNFRGQGYSAAMAGYTFNQLIDFTRTSAATYVDASGRIVPTPASRNLLTFTQEFDNAAWTKGDITATTNTATAPDGTLTADGLLETATTTNHYAQQNITTTAAATYTYSAFLKANGRNFAILSLASLATSALYAGASFNLATGVVVNTSAAGTGYSVVSSSITNVGNGWYRCTVTVVAGTTTPTRAFVGLSIKPALS